LGIFLEVGVSLKYEPRTYIHTLILIINNNIYKKEKNIKKENKEKHEAASSYDVFF
jgi:hypothetical protein